MKQSYILFFVTILLVAIVILPVVSFAEEKSEKIKNMEGSFARGAKLWANRCSSCHNIRDPKDYSDDEWKVVVTHMRVRANLKGQDARDILKFLQSSN